MLWIAFFSECLHYITYNSYSILPHIPTFLTRAEVNKVGITHYFNIKKAKKELNYHPIITTKEGAIEMANKYNLKNYSNNNNVKQNNINKLFFRFSSFYYWILCIGGMWLTYYIAFIDNPDSLTSTNYLFNKIRLLAYFIFQTRDILQWVFIIACIIHIMEALFACIIADAIGCSNLIILLWGIQTLLLGYPSLNIILDRMYKKYHCYEIK